MAKKTNDKPNRHRKSIFGTKAKFSSRSEGGTHETKYPMAEEGQKSCYCGCGRAVGISERAKKSNTSFLPGHDMRLKAKIKQFMNGKIREHGIPQEGWAWAKAKWSVELGLEPG